MEVLSPVQPCARIRARQAITCLPPFTVLEAYVFDTLDQVFPDYDDELEFFERWLFGFAAQ